MRHFRRVLLAAIALGLLVAMLGVGRAQAAEPAGSVWHSAATNPARTQTGHRADGLIGADSIRVTVWV